MTGDSHAHLLAPMRAFAESLGFTRSFESIPGETGGWCDQKARRIVVDADAPANAQLRILIHETVHALGVGYAEYGRKRAEVIVDTATAIACGSVGLESRASRSRISRAGARPEQLDAVTAFAKTIDELARQIENVLAAEAARECRGLSGSRVPPGVTLLAVGERELGAESRRSPRGAGGSRRAVIRMR